MVKLYAVHLKPNIRLRESIMPLRMRSHSTKETKTLLGDDSAVISAINRVMYLISSL